MANLFGASPQQIKVPPGSGLPNGGIYLANRAVIDGKPKSLMILDPETKRPIAQQGGYRLYRNHCLHCHGVSGAGDGPTAAFLYPRPRDYRKGIFKFTSTRTGAKPTRDDLRKTIRNGLHGTSMPAFEALMSPAEIEQVVDYTIFLSMRGETELALIDEAAIADENDPDPLPDDVVARHRRERLQQVEGGRVAGRQPAGAARPPDPREHPPRPRALPRPEPDRQ